MTADRPAVLALRDVSFRYAAGAPWAVDRCTLDVPAGLVVGIAGANGSGKSTLARLMQGLLRPASGTVTIDGLDTARTPVRRLAAHAGYVAQNPNHQLFASTVAAELAFGPRNLGLPAAEVEDRVADAARRLGLEDVLDRHPYHLGRARRKLVTIASVLAMRTPVLVLDEPTTAQDHRTSDVIGRLIRELRDARDGRRLHLPRRPAARRRRRPARRPRRRPRDRRRRAARRVRRRGRRCARPGSGRRR